MSNEAEIDPMDVLMKRRKALRERLDRIENNLKRGLDRDSEEQAQQLENHDTLLEIERVTAEELIKVEHEIAQQKSM